MSLLWLSYLFLLVFASPSHETTPHTFLLLSSINMITTIVITFVGSCSTTIALPDPESCLLSLNMSVTPVLFIWFCLFESEVKICTSYQLQNCLCDDALRFDHIDFRQTQFFAIVQHLCWFFCGCACSFPSSFVFLSSPLQSYIVCLYTIKNWTGDPTFAYIKLIMKNTYMTVLYNITCIRSDERRNQRWQWLCQKVHMSCRVITHSPQQLPSKSCYFSPPHALDFFSLFSLKWLCTSPAQPASFLPFNFLSQGLLSLYPLLSETATRGRGIVTFPSTVP